MWTFGVLEPSCYGAIDVSTGRTTLYVPLYPPEYAVWMGPIMSLEDLKDKYAVDEVLYVDDMPAKLNSTATLLTLRGVNSDSGLTSHETKFEGINRLNRLRIAIIIIIETGIEKWTVNSSLLYEVMADLRVYKTDFELDVMRYVVKVSSAAHRSVMRFAKPGKSEYQCEAVFLEHAYSQGGCRHASYTCICGSGPNSGYLHYGHAGSPNSRTLQKGR